jgi:hypothetical protein
MACAFEGRPGAAPPNQCIPHRIKAQDMNIVSRRREVLKAAAASLLLPSRTPFSPRPAQARAEPATPAAIAGTGWAPKANWRFGTAPGNNIARFSDWLRAGWFMNPTPKWLNNECQTYNTTDLTDRNANFMAFPDHCEIVAIWNGGPIASATGNGSISSLLVRYNVPFPTAVGYYEIEAQVPSASGAWPAWWTIGHVPGSSPGDSTWGPEIDVFEFNDTKTTELTSTLHGSRTPSFCFLRSGGNPPAQGQARGVVYAAHPWNMGSLTYRPGIDFAEAYHRYGVRIAPNYNISIWADDTPVGTFAANQYCDDSGRPVGVQLQVNLALGTSNPDPVRSIHTADFGGAGNRGPGNKFRLGIRYIQIWGA